MYFLNIFSPIMLVIFVLKMTKVFVGQKDLSDENADFFMSL